MMTPDQHANAEPTHDASPPTGPNSVRHPLSAMAGPRARWAGAWGGGRGRTDPNPPLSLFPVRLLLAASIGSSRPAALRSSMPGRSRRLCRPNERGTRSWRSDLGDPGLPGAPAGRTSGFHSTSSVPLRSGRTPLIASTLPGSPLVIAMMAIVSTASRERRRSRPARAEGCRRGPGRLEFRLCPARQLHPSPVKCRPAPLARPHVESGPHGRRVVDVSSPAANSTASTALDPVHADHRRDEEGRERRLLSSSSRPFAPLPAQRRSSMLGPTCGLAILGPKEGPIASLHRAPISARPARSLPQRHHGRLPMT